MPQAHNDFSAKQYRIIDRCLRDFFSVKAIDPPERIKDVRGLEIFSRLISSSESTGLKLLLSELGIAAHDRIVLTLHQVGIFEHESTYSDIWKSVRAVLECCIVKREQPDDAREFISLVRGHLEPTIRLRTFVAALEGVKLVGVDSVSLGQLTIVNSAKAYVETQAVKLLDRKSNGLIWKTLSLGPCLVGTFKGTHAAAKQMFSEQAHLATGMLAVLAGEAFDKGATTFRIAAVVDMPSEHGRAVLLHWDEKLRKLGFTANFGSRQLYELDKARVDQLTNAGVLQYSFQVLQNRTQTDLEEAVARAVYWYGDAHRDPVLVMRFVKYWSCIECFFSLEVAEIGDSLAAGIAVVLTFGHFQYLDRKDYSRNKQISKELYGKRSRALHSATHVHVTGSDVVTLSRWAAWLIVNALSFSNAGLDSRRRLLDRVRAIDAVESSCPSQGVST